MCNSFAKPSCTLFITPSSAFCCSVSFNKRFVSSNSLAFSNATLMLFARVSSSRTSESLMAFSLSICCRLIFPVTFSPTSIGTYTADFGCSVPGTFFTPKVAATSSKFLLIRIFSRVAIRCFRKIFNGRGAG